MMFLFEAESPRVSDGDNVRTSEKSLCGDNHPCRNASQHSFAEIRLVGGGYFAGVNKIRSSNAARVTSPLQDGATG